MLLQARAVDNHATGEWSPETRYRIEIVADADGDGLPDDWEAAHGLSPGSGEGINGSDGDPDGDGAGNLSEYIADTDPTNDQSVLKITGISWDNSGTRISWQGGTGAWQFLEIREQAAGAEDWRPIFTNPPVTAIATNILDQGATNTLLFYRIKAGR